MRLRAVVDDRSVFRRVLDGPGSWSSWDAYFDGWWSWLLANPGDLAVLRAHYVGPPGELFDCSTV